MPPTGKAIVGMPREPDWGDVFVDNRRQGLVTNSSSNLQELRRELYVRAKAEPSWRFEGLYVHVREQQTLREAYRLAKSNNAAAGTDGVTFEAIDAQGLEEFLDQLRDELTELSYRPQPARKGELPKEGRQVGRRSIPPIRDRVVQGALKLVLEQIFEADFQGGSFGYSPKKSGFTAIQRVTDAIVSGKTYVIDLDLQPHFSSVRHQVLLQKVEQRVRDDDVLWLLRVLLEVSGEQGVPQGAVISPLLSNIYLNEVGKVLEKVSETTRQGQRVTVDYARFGDDLVILVDSDPQQPLLRQEVERRLRKELANLQAEANEDKSDRAAPAQVESFGVPGFERWTWAWFCQTLGLPHNYRVVLRVKFRRKRSTTVSSSS